MNVEERTAKIPPSQRKGVTGVVVLGITVALLLYWIGAEIFSRVIYYSLGIFAVFVGAYFFYLRSK
jgi:hypothetical protein